MKFMMSRVLRLIYCGLVICLAAPAFAQNLTGVLSGNVTDQNGAAVPGATVSITNAATQATVFTGTTDDNGAYLAPSLPVGTYNLTFEAANFKKVEVSSVVLQVDQRSRVDAELPAGEITETITVSGEAFGQLERDSSSQDEVINTRQVQDLPLPSRNVLNLLTLVAGVSTGGLTGTGTNPGLNTRQISINGSRTLNTEVTVDGVSVLNGTTGEVTTLPSTEALREFKVLTSGYSAEYGRTSGGYINAIVASGTRDFHGGIYEYFRNEKLNANNFFNNARPLTAEQVSQGLTKQPRPIDRYNQFGFRLGGPVVLPRFGEGGPALTQDRDRTFFFFVYEGLRRQLPGTPVSTVPDARYRSGDFSPILANSVTLPNGTRTDGFLRDPRINAPCGIVGGEAVRTGCFPGNRIPESRFDPAARRIIPLLPLPNTPGNADTVNGRQTNNFVNPQSTPQDRNEITTRIDHNAFGGNTRIFGRLTRYKIDDFSTNVVAIPGILDPVASGESPTYITGYQVALGVTQTISPSLIIEGTFGFLRANQQRIPLNQGIDITSVLGIGRPINTQVAAVVPRINISNFRELGVGANATSTEITNTFQPQASASYVRGNNNLKFGFQLRKNQFNVFNAGGNYAGVYNFNGGITAPTSGGGPGAVYSFADFLLGQISTATYSIPQPLTGRRNYNLGFFVQDDWKVTPRLTLNLGLRYEYETPISVVNDINARIDDRTGQLLVAGVNSSSTLDLKTDRNNFAPRVGLAYSLNDQTVLRAAFGIFYSQIFSNLGGNVTFPGFSVTRTYQGRGTGLAQLFTLSEGIPVDITPNLADPLAVTRSASVNSPLSASAQFAETDPLPYTMLWNVGVQRQLPGDIVVDASYVGSRGLHLPLNLPVNQPSFESALEIADRNQGAFTQGLRPYPTVAGFSPTFNAGTSEYHSLQLKGSRQFTRSLSFLTSYTFSKSIDDGSGLFGSSQPNGVDAGQFPNLFRFLDRAPSAFDRTHIYSLAVQYTTERYDFLPNLLGRALGGFQFNPLITARTGLPDTITQNNANPLATQQRPTVVNSNSIYAGTLTPEGTGIRYLISPIIVNTNGTTTANPDFPYAPVGPFFTGTGASRRLVLPVGIGTLGRNTVRLPGEFNFDLSVSRRIALGERLAVQLRGEAFNILNHTNFNAPNTGLGTAIDSAGNPYFNSPNFGLITGAQAARTFQLVVRFDF